MSVERRTGVAAAAAVAVCIAVAVWVPETSTHERELAWLRTYAVWFDGVEDDRRAGRGDAIRACHGFQFLERTPTVRLHRSLDGATESARAAEQRWWRLAVRGVLLATVDTLARRSGAAAEPRLGALAAPIAGRRVDVRCWPAEAWGELEAEWRALRHISRLLDGAADAGRSRIHLPARMCRPVLSLLSRGAVPPRDTANYPNALLTLAHEAEHLRRPAATEGEVECWAMQRVRALVLAARGSRELADTFAERAESDARFYARFTERRLGPECRNGGLLDLRRDDPAWP